MKDGRSDDFDGMPPLQPLHAGANTDYGDRFNSRRLTTSPTDTSADALHSAHVPTSLSVSLAPAPTNRLSIVYNDEMDNVSELESQQILEAMRDDVSELERQQILEAMSLTMEK